MQPSRKIAHIHEVVMDTPLFYESTLGIGDENVHVRGKPLGKNLGDNLGHGMHKTNRPIVRDAFSALLFGQKDNIGGVEPMKVRGVEGVESLDDPHDSVFNDSPTLF